jgi:c-di-GMP-binding flagellar brake protein YcgR
MSETTPAPVKSDLLDPQALPRFQIHSQKEIRHQLRVIADHRHLLIAHIDGGPLTFVTTVLDLTAEGEEVILDSSSDAKIIERVKGAESLVCSGRQDGVRIQFTVESPKAFPHDGIIALRCALPAMLLRLQRRESFRLPVPLSSPLVCRLDLRDEGNKPIPLDVHVLDISSEGIGLLVTNADAPLEAGQTIDSELNLPDLGVTHVPLHVRNVARVEGHTGAVNMRVGFQLVDPPMRVVTAIQRYVFKIERERRLLETNR